MNRLFASGTPGGGSHDGSASAPGTGEHTSDDGSADDQEQLEASPEEIQAELDRLRNQNAQLLSEKSAAEEARREARELRQVIAQMNRRDEAGPSDEEIEQVEDLRRTAQALRDSDDPRDRFVLEMAKELSRTKKQLDLVKSGKGKIAEADMPEVERLMNTGDYRTINAAHKALLGQRYEELQRKQAEAGGGGGGDPAPKRPAPKPAQPVATVVRGVPREKAAERTVIKASEYRQRLRGDDGAEWRQKRLSGSITVIPG